MTLGNILGTTMPGQKTHIYVPDFDKDIDLFTGDMEDAPDTWDGIDVIYMQTSDGNDALYDKVGSGVLCISIEHE